MSSYKYIDPDYVYTDPVLGVLRNKAGIDDDRLLTVFESLKISARMEEFRAKPLKIKNSETLLAIHNHLFQDVYEWAGRVRTVEISKGGTPFFTLELFHRAFTFIDSLIAEFRAIERTDKATLAHKLAEILDAINFLHPFREGNGRTQREFLRLLALEKGLTLNLNPPDNLDVYQRYMSGTINGDVELLAGLIREIIS